MSRPVSPAQASRDARNAFEGCDAVGRMVVFQHVVAQLVADGLRMDELLRELDPNPVEARVKEVEEADRKTRDEFIEAWKAKTVAESRVDDLERQLAKSTAEMIVHLEGCTAEGRQ